MAIDFIFYGMVAAVMLQYMRRRFDLQNFLGPIRYNPCSPAKLAYPQHFSF